MSVALAIFALVAINLLVATSPAQGKHAATLINCSGSIQACIDAASDGDTILIAAGRYTESLTLSKPVSLTGVSSDTTIIHAVEGQRVLTVTVATITSSVVISGLTFTGGNTDSDGGGIWILTNMRPLIRNISVSDNFATRNGGGLYSDSLLTMSNSTFISNTAYFSGGGAWFNDKTIVASTTFISNVASHGWGGGAALWGQANVTDTTFVHNTADRWGGGAWFDPDGVDDEASVDSSIFLSNTAYVEGGGATFFHKARVSNTIFSGNIAPHGGGAYFEGQTYLTATTFTHNTAQEGGGAYFLGYGGNPSLGYSAVIDVMETTFDDNTANYGGGTYFFGYPRMIGDMANTRFSANSSTSGQGSALYIANNDPSIIITLRHGTISSPTISSAMAISTGGVTLDVTNTIIANHAVGINNTGGIANEDYNLVFNTFTNTIGTTSGGHSLIGDPRFVDPLNNDYHLQFGSLAIDHGVNAGVYTDLDGHPRPIGLGFDIGAYEYTGGPAYGTRYVATTGNDAANDCLDSLNPCATAQHAVDVVTENDEVRIASGTYTDLSIRPRNDVTTTGVVTQVVYLSKTVILHGGYTTTNWLVSDPLSNPTVLDAQAQGRLIYVTGNVSPTIEGLRLTGGNPEAAIDGSTCTGWWDCETVGAAVYAWQANLTLNESQIDNNDYGRFDGGSIYINSGHATLTHNAVMSNVNGGGIALSNSSGVISGNLIISNSVYGDGGGVLVKFSTATLINNFIISNTASYVCGGGVCIGYGSATLDNNTIRGNSILAGTGGGVNVFSSTATMRHNLIADNHAGNVLNIDGGGVSVEFNSNADLVGNTIRHNSATAGGARGGGVLIRANSQAALTGNIIEGNVSGQGGGVSVDRYSSATLVNNLIDQNSSSDALYVGGSAVRILYNTFADSENSKGIYVTDYAGTSSIVALTNTILASHTIGIDVTQGSTVTVDSVLWHATPITIAQTATATITARNSIFGDPRFVDPPNGDYHLQVGSAAIDHGIDAGVYTDLDGHSRPSGAGFDIGAYEFVVGPTSGKRYVATTGNDAANDCLNGVNPCATIQHAIHVANDGEQVLIASGLYTQSATLYKPVSLTGVSSDTTIIHAVTGQRVLTVTGATISNSVVISGLTFTGGNGDQGGGIYADAPLKVLNSRFISNTASVNGGGLYARAAITLSNVDFTGNLATYGGGVFAERNVTLIGGEFSFNHCNEFKPPECLGGALAVAAYPASPADLVITGTRFISNSALNNSWGGAVYFGSRGDGRIVNALFANNSTQGSGAALFLNFNHSVAILNSTITNLGLNSASALAVFNQATVSITNTIIANHMQGIDVYEGWGSTVTEDYNLFFGNVTNTVGVASGGHSLIGDSKFIDPLNGNYHLQFGSAAIDHGINAGVYTDLDGHPRPIGAGFDIGAYEYQSIHYLWLPVIRK